MASIYDVDPNELIERAAQELKKIAEIKPPEWARFVKTGAHKERPPVNQDWWYIRTAAILRSVYKLGPVGVSKLRTKYGGKKRRGYKPPEFRKGSGNIIRKILQQLEEAKLIKKVDKGVHKGRIITPKGKSLLDKTAVQLSKGKKTEAPKPVVKPPEAKKPQEEIKKEVVEKKPTEKKTEEEPKEEKKEEKPKEKAEKKETKKKIPTVDELVTKTKEFVKK